MSLSSSTATTSSTTATATTTSTTTTTANYTINIANTHTINSTNSLNNNFTNSCFINNNNIANNSNNSNTNVILQTLKRRTNKPIKPLDERVCLEKIFGFTITSNVRLAQSHDGTIAYLAGCVIVLYDIKTYKQDFIISNARKTLTTLAFSADGKIIATGESGHDPKVRVWDVKDKVQIAEFSGHKFLIECVCFSTSPNSSLIISIGSVHDMVINVWNWKTKFKVASNKIASKIKGIAFSKDGNYFVTVGNRLVKFWYLTVSTLMETVPLKGRAAILGDMRNHYFCDVVCGRLECSQLSYAITTSGNLCEFDDNRSLSKVIDLKVDRAYCITNDDYYLFIGCSFGTILIFKQKNLEFIASLPRPHNLGVDISKGSDTRHLIENLNNCDLKYPDCVAITYCSYYSYLCAIYNDHSFYIWDINDVNKVKKIDSHLYHSSCCWSIDIYSNLTTTTFNNSTNSYLPHDSFITSSTDNTLRIWSLNNDLSSTTTTSSLFNNNNYSIKLNNIYSKELLHIIYIDNDLSALCDVDPIASNTSTLTNEEQVSVSSSYSSTNYKDNNSQNNSNSNSNSNNNTSNTNNEAQNTLKLGARCIKLSPLGHHLATGDRNGNIRIYDLKHLESIMLIEAHDSEILYLQYSQPESGKLLLASSGRDRLIHIFDAKKNYELIQTLDDHSAAITASRFCYNQIEKQFYIISCGFDKSIIFRCAQEHQQSFNNNDTYYHNYDDYNSSSNINTNSKLQFQRTNFVVEKQTFYDLIVDPTKNYINTVSQDRIVRTYSIKDGKKLRQFKGSLNEDGSLIKMDIDRTGTLLATSCTDKCVYIWDLNTCECLAFIYGHSEVIIDLKFTFDNKHLITVSVDGCIFVWKLNGLTSYMQQQQTSTSSSTSSTLSNNNHRKSQVFFHNMPQQNLQQQPNSRDFILNPTESSNLYDDFENDAEKLPSWASNKLTNSNIHTNSTNNINKTNDLSINPQTNNNNNNNNSSATNNIKDATRKSRAVWGPICNTSFAIMVDNEFDESSPKSCESSQTQSKNKTQTNTASASINYGLLSGNNANGSPEINLPIVQFPSPNIDKGHYQVIKSLNISTNGEDLQSDEIPSTPVKEIENFTCNYDNILNQEDETVLNKFISPNINQQQQQPQTQINLENSRRQSLSTRYLMKSQQISSNTVSTNINTTPCTTNGNISISEYEKEKQRLNADENKDNKNNSDSTNLQHTLKNDTSTLSNNTSSTYCVHSTNNNLFTNKLTTNYFPFISTSTSSISSAQMAAELLKIRKNKASNYLHNQHTESSLNKVKSKQQQQQQSSDTVHTKLNKSPSINSLASTVESNNGSDDVLNLNENNRTTHRKITSKTSPIKPNSLSITNSNTTGTATDLNTNINSENGVNNGLNDNSLHKAASMLSLNTNVSTGSHTSNNPILLSTSGPTTTSTVISKSYTSTTTITTNTNISQPKPVSSTNTNGDSQIASINSNNCDQKPPKTLKQIKQRSNDRQSNSNTFSNKGNINNGIISSESNRLRRLSNSTQNVHQLLATQSPTKDTNKRPQRQIFQYNKNSNAKVKRSNTEEIISGQHHSSENYTNTTLSTKLNTHNSQNADNNCEKKASKDQIPLNDDCKKILDELKYNTSQLDIIYNQLQSNQMSEFERSQKFQIIETLNSHISSYLKQFELINK